MVHTHKYMADKYVTINGQRIKVTVCKPRKAKGASLPRRAKGPKGQTGARYLAKESGQIEAL
ncbi:MAG: hypothetical protein ACWGQW_01675 [bacterium]